MRVLDLRPERALGAQAVAAMLDAVAIANWIGVDPLVVAYWRGSS
jgi:hypothetical protein